METEQEESRGQSLGLTPEKLQDSGVLSSRWPPSSGPSPVVKLPRELLPFFRMSGSLGSSHSMVGPAVEGECTDAGSEVLMVLSPPPSQDPLQLCKHTQSSSFVLPFITQHPTTAWLLTGQTATAVLDQRSVTQPHRRAAYQDTSAPPTGNILLL